jgi:hypothetical protein
MRSPSIVLTIATAVWAAGPAPAAGPVPAIVQPAATMHRDTVVPFAVGEHMTYRLRAEWLFVDGGGEASLKVEAVDTVHAFPAYRLAFQIKGGFAFFKMDDVQRSWLDVDGLFSRRFQQQLNQTGYSRDRTYVFLPDEMRYFRPGVPSDTGRLATPIPLDDVSFIYHVRMMPLVVGQTHTEPRYYKQEGNPVRVRVLRTERTRVPAGEFDAIVVQPTIGKEGLFSADARPEVWLSNDSRRLVLRVKAKVKVATITMELRSYTPGTR